MVATETERLLLIYAANPCLKRRGILKETFLQYPDEIIQSVFFGESEMESPTQEGHDYNPSYATGVGN